MPAYWNRNPRRDKAPLQVLLEAEVDHITPVADGGGNEEENLQTSCLGCNSKKGRRIAVPNPRGKSRRRDDDPEHWDGLTAVFLALADEKPEALDAGLRRWAKALRAPASSARSKAAATLAPIAPIAWVLPPGLNMARESERVALPAGGEVKVRKATFSLKKTGPSQRSFDKYRKTVLDFEGRPMFAELVVVRMFEKAGWESAWLDSYWNRRLRGDREHLESVQLPPVPSRLLANINAHTGTRGGAFDVVAWRDDLVVFVEAKRAKKDGIRRTQRRWLEAALAVGVPLDHVLIVEWNVG